VFSAGAREGEGESKPKGKLKGTGAKTKILLAYYFSPAFLHSHTLDTEIDFKETHTLVVSPGGKEGGIPRFMGCDSR